jgi:hypothetical protein
MLLGSKTPESMSPHLKISHSLAGGGKIEKIATIPGLIGNAREHCKALQNQIRIENALLNN